MKTPPHVPHPTSGGFMKGCLIVVGILALVCVILGVVVAFKWKGWAATATVMVAETAIKNSDLPPAQQAQLTGEIRKLADDFQSGRLTTAGLERVMHAISNGPLIPAAAVLAARQKYIEPSDMSPDEKAAAMRALQRYARGIFEKKVPTDSMQTVTESIVLSPGERDVQVTETDGKNESHIVVTSGSRSMRFKDHATRVEIDRFVAQAKQAADTAGIPDQPFEPDWGVELKKAIDDARKGL